MAGKKHYPTITPLGGSTRGKDQDNRSVITSWYEAIIKYPTMTVTNTAPSLEALESKVFGVRLNIAGQPIKPPEKVRIFVVKEERLMLYEK